MTLKKLYNILILPYTIILLYFMFLGFDREVMSVNIVRLKPLASTISFIKNTLFLKSIIINLVGNVVMFIPFGFLGWSFPGLKNLKQLLISFLSGLIIIETLQYFTRLGVFDIDDILINSLGVCIGFYLRQLLEKAFKIS